MKPVPNEFPSADPGALRLALVGESPGADECAQGRPFVGKSGWILNQYLASAGIARAQCFVGNVCQHRPSPSSNEFHLFDWNEARVQEGIAALREDLARFRPHCVVALGNAALHLLRHGNAAPPKSAKLRLFQWTSHVGTWRGSLFLGARDFDCWTAAELRMREETRYKSLSADCGALEVANALSRESPCPGSATPFPAAPVLAEPAGSKDPAQSPSSCRDSEARESTGWSVANSATTLAAAGSFGGGPMAEPSGRQDELRTSTPATFKCLATYHPAATFREPSFAFPLVSDLKRAVAEARTPQLILPPRRIAWGLTTGEVEARCDAIRAAASPVGFDIEGGLGGLQCCSFATSPCDAFVVDLMNEQLERPRTLAALAAVLEDPAVPKVCWNAAYERAILEAVASVTMRGYEDGMLAWWERFSELPKGLDFVASILTREPYWAEGIGWDRKTGAPKVTGPRFWTYNGIDSCVTLEIWQHPLIRAVVEARQPVPFETP